MKKTLNKGFTLIELLVVVAIIAVLALIVLLALNPVEMARRSRDSRRLSDLGAIRTAIDLALADKQTLGGAEVGPVDVSTSADGTTDLLGTGLNISKYLSTLPKDPVNDGSSGNVQTITSGCGTASTPKEDMGYMFWTDGDVYVLETRLESKENCPTLAEDGTDDDYYRIGTDPGLDMTNP